MLLSEDCCDIWGLLLYVTLGQRFSVLSFSLLLSYKTYKPCSLYKQCLGGHGEDVYMYTQYIEFVSRPRCTHGNGSVHLCFALPKTPQNISMLVFICLCILQPGELLGK